MAPAFLPLNIYLLLAKKGVIGVWLMSIRGTLAIIVGLMQSAIAGLALVFACSLHFNFFGVQERLNGPVGFYRFHVLVLLVFGFLFVVSGLSLVYEWLESR